MIVRHLLQSILCAAILAAGAARADGVVAGKSEIGFTMKAMGVDFDGRFGKWKADIVFQPKALATSKAVIDIDLGSIDFASEESDTEAKGPLWFDTVKFPVAHFASTSIRDVGGNRYEVAGKLTLKGLTRDCVVAIALRTGPAGERSAEGTFALKRLEYRIGEGEWADTGTVGNDILVHVRMVLSPSA